MRKLLRYLLLTTAIVGALLGVGLFVLNRAAQKEPEFYQQALQVEPAQREVAGDELEQQVLELHNEVRQPGVWEAVFTEDQINGWLAADLPHKFPRALPKGTQEPRVSIADDLISVACRFDNGKLKTVISFELDVELTTETNTLAVRVGKLRAGVLPVPLKQILDKIAAAAKRSDLPLRWSQADGEPIALVTVPVQHEDYVHREIYVDKVEVRDGAVYLAGHTERQEATAGHETLTAYPVKKATIHR